MTSVTWPTWTDLRTGVWQRALFAGGMVAALLYIAMTLFVGMLWEGYSITSHTISELSAIGAPTRPLWIVLSVIYTVPMIGFGWIVWRTAVANRALRVVGILVMAHGVFAFFWPPMHQREVLAAGGATLTDTLHIAWMMVAGLFFVCIIGFGAAALGTRFRVFSIAMLAIALACGAMTGTYSASIEANLPTPAVGVWERISAAAYMVWVIVLAAVLLRNSVRSMSAPTCSGRNGRTKAGASRRRPSTASHSSVRGSRSFLPERRRRHGVRPQLGAHGRTESG
jgi:hypothetical membrane protein